MADALTETRFENWEQEDGQAYAESVAQRTAGFGVVIAAVFYVLIFFTCAYRCCCTKWKEPSSLSGTSAKRNFCMCMLVAVVCMLVALIPISLGATAVVQSGGDIIHRAADLTVELDARLLCGNDDARVSGGSGSICKDNTMGKYLQNIYGGVIYALDATIAGITDIEADLSVAIASVEAEVNASLALLGDMETTIENWEADSAIISRELTALNNPDNVEEADFSGVLPDASVLPDSAAFAADVAASISGAESSVDSIDAATAAVEELTGPGGEFLKIRDDYGEGGDEREEIVGSLAELFTSLRDTSKDLAKYEGDIRDVGETYDERTVHASWASIVLFLIAPLWGIYGLNCAYGCCRRSKFSSFMPFNIWSCLFGLHLFLLAGLFGTITVVMSDVCENDYEIMRLNLDQEVSFGDTTIVMSDVIVEILTCPSTPEPPVVTPDNNLVDILGINSEFNFTADFDGVREEFNDSKDEILAMAGDVNAARGSLVLAEDAITTDVRQGYNPDDIGDPMRAFRDQLLPPHPLDRNNNTQQAHLLLVYPDSPTLNAVTVGDVEDFWAEFQGRITAVNDEIDSMIVVPLGYPSSYDFATIAMLNGTDLENDFWRDGNADGQADAGVGPEYATYGSAGGYAILVAAVDAAEGFNTALDTVEEVNNEAKANATEIIDAAYRINGSISEIQAAQVELQESLNRANASLNAIDDGNGGGLLGSSIDLIDATLGSFQEILDQAAGVSMFAFCGVIGDFWRDSWESSTCTVMVENGMTAFYGMLVNLVLMFCALLATSCMMPAHWHENYDRRTSSFAMPDELEMSADLRRRSPK